ncbi:MAG: hypothetical protein AB7V43_01095 [Acidimicrobiia bacterium]
MIRRLNEDRGDDRGSATVAAIALMLSLTGGTLLWLTSNVDRSVNAASDADAIAFQAARAGAQAVDPASLRTAAPTVNSDQAPQLAIDAAAALLRANETAGRVITVNVTADRVTVVVEITEGGRIVTGQGTARLAVGVRGEGT